MNQRRRDSDEPVVGGYHTEKLDDVSTRLARIEGEMKSLATKEDVANAKFNLLATWVGIGVAIAVGVAGIVARFWPANPPLN
jgi:hypothetical protein